MTPAVASPHPLATQAGMQLLDRGASAEEATVAVAAVLGVVWPHMTGIGGDAFFMLYDRGNVRALNASGFSGSQIDVSCAAIPERGPGAVLTVPGAVAGWNALLAGKPLSEELLEPAIQLASKGAPIDNMLRRWMRPETAPWWREVMMHSTEDTFTQPQLATTLSQLANGADFYRGEISRQLCESFTDWGVQITLEDFAFQHADWVDPIHTSFCGHEVWTTPPNSQGFATLHLLEAAARFWASENYREQMVETTRRVFRYRNDTLCDPASVKGDTVAFSVVDEQGRGISAIQSVYFDWGSGMLCPRTGILLQNRGVAFSLNPEHPNAIAPRKRPAHTLCPALVTRDGQLTALIGTMGGDGQPQTLTQVLTALLAAGKSPQEAVAAYRWLYGRTWGAMNDSLFCEDDRSNHDMFGHCNLIDLRGPEPVAVSDWRAR